jgi:FkbM family methyltransferase
MNNIHTTVIDAGGRFGLHPSWSKFKGELNYHLFEPDKVEANRLIEKYTKRSDVTVSKLALLDKEKEIRLYHFNNLAMSSCNKRNKIVSWFKGEREHEEDVTGYSDVKSTTVDDYCKEHNISVDFLKLDTEGSEHLILKGAELQLSESILGVRSEVSFDFIFDDSVLFSKMHDFMLDRGYYLLNIDYDGRGDFKSHAVNCTKRYGEV